MTETIKAILKRDLEKLKQELSLYKTEGNLWRVEDGISNSAGNLALHLVGNLRTYIGLHLGKIDYVRNREAEFTQKHIPRVELIQAIDDTIERVSISLDLTKKEELTKQYGVLIWEQPTSIEFVLIHLCGHLNYHLGQINYHRRLLDI